MKQGDIYLINLDPTLHSEIGKTRPGMIISVDAMNSYSPRLIIAPITSVTEKVYPFEVFLPHGTGGLKKDSKIMLDQIKSIDKQRLVRKIGSVSREILVNACIIAQNLISPGE